MSTETTPSPAPLPTLSPEDAFLLHNYIALGRDLVALAQHTSRTYIDLTAWTSLPHIAAYFDHIDSLDTRRQRSLALAALEELLKTTRDPIERRRTAGAILRATDPQRSTRPRKPSGAPVSITTAPIANPATDYSQADHDALEPHEPHRSHESHAPHESPDHSRDAHVSHEAHTPNNQHTTHVDPDPHNDPDSDPDSDDDPEEDPDDIDDDLDEDADDTDLSPEDLLALNNLDPSIDIIALARDVLARRRESAPPPPDS